MNLATDGQIATVTKFLATDGQIATVVQTLLKADLGARKNGGIGAAVGQRGNARGRYEAIGREYTVAMVLPDASDPHDIICTCLFAFA